ncbi:hypothetical protein ABZ128_22505 [Streptomyces sp. NPDC006326]|uniref:hypothetical protein n=1 Tax=Streptomyces sp. NPDC006326 TaxID=3156752 RepID=UPI0033BB7286
MSEIAVVYELGRPVTAHTTAERPVLRVHAAPAAPDRPSVPGPRTFCGRDTFAMERSPYVPAEHPGSPWYPPQYANLVCPACDDVADSG